MADENVSPYIILVQIIFSGPLGSFGSFLSQFENRVPLRLVQGGVGSVALLQYFRAVFLLPEDLHSELILFLVWLRGLDVKSDYISSLLLNVQKDK